MPSIYITDTLNKTAIDILDKGGKVTNYPLPVDKLR